MKHTLAVFIGITLVLVPATAFGQGMSRSVCGERENILAALERLYGETPAALALEKSGMAVEVLNSSEGTWTLLFTQPDGQACVIEYGKGWQTIEAKVESDSRVS